MAAAGRWVGTNSTYVCYMRCGMCVHGARMTFTFGKCFCFCCADLNLKYFYDICTGYDNTLHTVPVCWVLDRNKPTNESFPLASEQITSFIVPFAGPHECPNSKTCPNNGSDDVSSSGSTATTRDRLSSTDSVNVAAADTFSPLDINELVASDGLYNTFFFKSSDNNNLEVPPPAAAPMQECNNEFVDCAELLESDCGAESTKCDSGNPCPYPCCVVWWRTLDAKNCAIIGYSDGSICIVGESRCGKNYLQNIIFFLFLQAYNQIAR